MGVDKKRVAIDEETKNIMTAALNIARKRRDKYITPEHLLLGFLEDDDFVNIVDEIGGQECFDVIINECEESLDEIEKNEENGNVYESHNFLNILSTCYALSINRGFIIKTDLLYAFKKTSSIANDIIEDAGLEVVDIVNRILEVKSATEFEKTKNMIKQWTENIKKEKVSDSVHINKSRKKEAWEEFLTLLNESIETKSIPLIGRDEEIYRMSQILCRATKNNPILVGEPGVGKTAIVEGFVKKIIDKEVPDKLLNAQVYSLDLGDLISGTQYRGEFEERLKIIMNGLSNNVENPILYIDEIHNIVGLGSGSTSGMDCANMIKKYAQDGKIKFIGTTTFDEYKKKFTKDKALDRRFKKINVVEPSVEDCIKILNGSKDFFENYHGIKYSNDAIETAVVLSDKYINDKFLPDKAIDLIDEAGATFSMTKSSKKKEVSKELIEEILAKTCNIPKKTLESSDISSLVSLDKNIKKQVFGQDNAVDAIAKNIKKSRAGLKDSNKPIASLLFVGPTGVGKTEIAKATAKIMFGSEDKLIRFDMSEYMEEHSVSKLIGSPAGYVGYDDGGLLVDKIIQNPSCVLLFDEIEKAHPKVFNALLQIMDYATLTDNKGRKADFRNVLIIMTSNTGAHKTTSRLGFGASDKPTVNTDGIMDAVKSLFTPEFRGRLTDIIVFNPLDDEMGKMIVDKQLNNLKLRLSEKNISVTFTKNVKQYILDKGVNKTSGARGISTIIDSEIEDLFIDEILAGKLKNGGSARIDYKDNSLKFTCKELS